MKILPIINSMKKDVTSSGIRLRHTAEDAYKISTRTAKIYNQNNLTKYINITKYTGSKIIKNTKKEEIPYIAGAIGMFIPVPMTSVIMFALGMIVRFSLPDPELDNDIKPPSKNKFTKDV